MIEKTDLPTSEINNPDFNSIEFEGIKNEAGRNSFYLFLVKKELVVEGQMVEYLKELRF